MENPSEFNGDVFDSLFDDTTVQVDDQTAPSQTADVDVNPDLIDDQPKEEPTEIDPQEEPIEETPSDYITQFLSSYGIENGTITYENEDGTTEDVNFNDLDDEEKLNILKEISSPNLSEDEIATINYLRQNNATIQDVVEYYSQKAVKDYIEKNAGERTYSVDAYSDDELYVAELKAKYADMTDEEMQADLNAAKENETLFKKKVDIIRNQYKAQEEEREKENARQQEERYNNFKDSIYNQINDFSEISLDYKDTQSDSLSIEDSEKDAIYKYILDRDADGATQFFKDINDPQKLVEMAWFSLFGKDAISDISNYWKTQLKNSRKADVSKTQPRSQATVVKKDVKPRDTFMDHHRFESVIGGDDLL